MSSTVHPHDLILASPHETISMKSSSLKYFSGAQ